MNKPNIGFCGLGLMGAGMAGRLLKAGYPLSVYNRTADRAAELVQGGATLAATPAQAAMNSRIVISMVADDAASRDIWLGAKGALSTATAGTLLMECSTVSPAWIKELSAAAAQRNCPLLDAPVTGSKNQAAAGELSFLVGGDTHSLSVARPLLEIMGRQITHLGDVGSGALMKLINNFVCGVQAASLAEAIALIERTGLDRDKAVAVLTNGAPGSPLFKAISARMIAADYTPNFKLELMAKDLRYARHEGEAVSLDLKTASAALGIFDKAIAAGEAENDFSAIIEQLRKH